MIQISEQDIVELNYALSLLSCPDSESNQLGWSLIQTSHFFDRYKYCTLGEIDPMYGTWQDSKLTLAFIVEDKWEFTFRVIMCDILQGL